MNTIGANVVLRQCPSKKLVLGPHRSLGRGLLRARLWEVTSEAANMPELLTNHVEEAYEKRCCSKPSSVGRLAKNVLRMSCVTCTTRRCANLHEHSVPLCVCGALEFVQVGVNEG